MSPDNKRIAAWCSSVAVVAFVGAAICAAMMHWYGYGGPFWGNLFLLMVSPFAIGVVCAVAIGIGELRPRMRSATFVVLAISSLGAAFLIGRATAPQQTVPTLAAQPDGWDLAEAEGAAMDAKTVYVTHDGAKYHRAGCSYLRTSGTPTTRAVAVAKGLGPCSRCKP
ncbi:MAG: hypothetical protein JNK35_00580 [Phycisphaerae bacterium]|nr:hypothetical protein [Phycisphaerae bacterium]